jgi:hypothetical protein
VGEGQPFRGGLRQAGSVPHVGWGGRGGAWGQEQRRRAFQVFYNTTFSAMQAYTPPRSAMNST